ncbi:MAG: hypothetical protein EHM42_02175, partial [Planctomycetaceae bacterium]
MRLCPGMQDSPRAVAPRASPTCRSTAQGLRRRVAGLRPGSGRGPWSFRFSIVAQRRSAVFREIVAAGRFHPKGSARMFSIRKLVQQLLHRSGSHRPSSLRRRRFLTPGVSADVLEARCLLSSFGVAWPDARTLSVSFPSDSAQIGAYDNSLRLVLDQVQDRQVWQEAILHAFQTWSVSANVNIGLVPDRGDPLGTAGLAANDPRFGEFRIGGIPQTGVLASALPYQQVAGTWSGDVLLNTQINYFLADWRTAGPYSIPSANEKGPPVELYSVMLHEAGNALGLDDNALPSSVMYASYSGPKTRLTASDIAAIQKIYGPRRDPYELKSNNTASRAMRITTDPVVLTSATPGSLQTRSDVDFYKFRPLAGQEQLTVRLIADGISLVKSKIEILDSAGNLLADAKADSVFENNLRLEIGSLQDHSELFVRVSSNTSDVFGVGDYRLELDYRLPEQQPDIDPRHHDADATDDSETPVDYVSIDALFAQAGLVDREQGVNDTLGSATALTTPPGFLPGTRYEAQSAIASATDRDFWSFRAPAEVGGALSITVSPVGLEFPDLDVAVMNAAGDRVAARRTMQSDGTHAIVIDRPQAGARYIIGVQTAALTTVAQGNYLITADFATESATLTPLQSGTVTAAAETFGSLTVGKTQLFRFDLATASGV